MVQITHLGILLMETYSCIRTNILVDSPVNNTEYICASQTNDASYFSDSAYIIIAGEQYAHIYFDSWNKFLDTWWF